MNVHITMKAQQIKLNVQSEAERMTVANLQLHFQTIFQYG